MTTTTRQQTSRIVMVTDGERCNQDVGNLTTIQALVRLDSVRERCADILSGRVKWADMWGFEWVTNSGRSVMYFIEPEN